ncbi:hypothetical protein LMB56_06560 [Limosilactobacillus reuteri]|uniref:hypothetical protein n=1 Tax=Limosilactobacillus reuteri TaxID=1598 RepID=UPI001E4F5708|nr:hypothetical protein [Limosilactobacillus reuteri]MCC4436088.1 hypothetical protein [Limosilactobacillus reuteri]MCC4438385.1 hypothetical protein [Limosilactobacillus reuteri]MCC4442039.1 hypothetical protein [Limosilactobacillus reuteri]MCC4443979.1 hypothetical protein [Limosilactobacillus reuteri]MCC4446162.1 hypothetical protein [Limosilactobacillus reuteri]
MVKWLKDNWKVIGLIVLGLLLPMPILNFAMDFTPFDSLSNADDSAWLGFWGGYLGAALSIGGLYWQTNKQIKLETKNRKEAIRRQDQQIQKQESNRNEDIERQRDQYYNEARTIFMINECKELDRDINSHNYMSTQCDDVSQDFGHNWPSNNNGLPLIKIDNFSDNPMLAVKVVFIKNTNTVSDVFYINRIDKQKTATLISTFSASWYNKYVERNGEDFLGKLSKIKIFYTTNKGEQIGKEFIKSKDGFKLEVTCNQYQTDRKNTDTIYSVDNFLESSLYHAVAMGIPLR